jgi:hypothetical protein
MKIKTVRDLYLRWFSANSKLKMRPDAVCAHGVLKDRSIYRQQVELYTKVANVIWDNFESGIEILSEAEKNLIQTIIRGEK